MRTWKLAGGVTLAVVVAALARPETGHAEGDAKAGRETAETPLVALGRRLFHDPTVSRSGRHACASCHDPEHGWSDAKKVSDDNDGPTRRHSQPVTDLGGSGFHWDGEFPKIEDLVTARVGGAREAALAAEARRTAREKSTNTVDLDDVLGGLGYGRSASAIATLAIPDRLADDARYAPAFRDAFGDAAITSERVVGAVTAFVGSLRTRENALDRALAGDAAALSEPAKRGLDLFRGRGSCATCHVLTPGPDGRSPLTDRLYHDTGVAFRAAPGESATRIVRRNSGIRIVEAGPDAGRGEQTLAGADAGSFKTPSLRDVERRAPYMHDGSFETLEQVVRYYSAGGTPNAHLDPAIRKLDLTDAEVADLVAFLKSLTGGTRAGLLPERDGFRWVHVKVVSPAGKPVPDLAIEFQPSGERLGGCDAVASHATTTEQGEAVFSFPQTTHVTMQTDGWQLGGGRPVPDCANDFEVLAVPDGFIAVTIRGKSLPAQLSGVVTRPELVSETQDGAAFRVLEMRGCRKPADPVVLDRVRVLSDEASVYTAPVGKFRGAAFLRFKLDEKRDVAGAFDLSGGESPPVTLRPVASLDPMTK